MPMQLKCPKIRKSTRNISVDRNPFQFEAVGSGLSTFHSNKFDIQQIHPKSISDDRDLDSLDKTKMVCEQG